MLLQDSDNEPLLEYLNSDTASLQRLYDQASLCFYPTSQNFLDRHGTSWTRHDHDCFMIPPSNAISNPCGSLGTLILPTDYSKRDPCFTHGSLDIWHDKVNEKIGALASAMQLASDPALSGIKFWLTSDRTARGIINVTIPGSALLSRDNNPATMKPLSHKDTIESSSSTPEHEIRPATADMVRDFISPDTSLSRLSDAMLAHPSYQRILAGRAPFRIGLEYENGWRSVAGPEDPWAQDINRDTTNAEIVNRFDQEHTRAMMGLGGSSRYQQTTRLGYPVSVGVKADGCDWRRLTTVYPLEQDDPNDESIESSYVQTVRL